MFRVNVMENLNEINLTCCNVKKRKLPEWMVNLENKIILYPELLFLGNINYCYTIEDITSTCADILKNIDSSENCINLGYDAEWPTNNQTGSGKTALIQICQNEQICHLFHLEQQFVLFNGALAAFLCRGSEQKYAFCRWLQVYNLFRLPMVFMLIIRHPKVNLVGINIKNDIWKLGRDFNVKVQQIVENNCTDIAVLARNVLNTTQTWSLQKLTKHLLKKDINKCEDIRRSNWSNSLSETQKSYAATDAYASLMCYTALVKIQTSSDTSVILK